MAEWYGLNELGKEIGKNFDNTTYDNDPHAMLRAFWMDLILNASLGCTVYFPITPGLRPKGPSGPKAGLAMMPTFLLKLY